MKPTHLTSYMGHFLVKPTSLEELKALSLVSATLKIKYVTVFKKISANCFSLLFCLLVMLSLLSSLYG